MSRLATIKNTGELPIAAFLIATLLIYWPGLTGPYMFDDFWNLVPIEKWAAGQIAWHQALQQNAGSIIESRPLAMGSFMLTTWLGGVGTFPSKLGNLGLHLVCGWLVWRLALRLVSLDRSIREHARMLSLIVSAAWLLHPLHVSTVLYSIQRMSQLSAVAVLLCMLAYLSARDSILQGRLRAAALKLFVLFPALLLAGLLSKQNAIVAPALCLAIELLSRTDTAGSRGQRLIATFFVLFLAIPATAITINLLMYPTYVLDGYRDWDFSWQERLLTQSRVLVDYIGSILVPYSPGMGLYTDDFPVSTGLLHPPTTIASILFLIGVTVLAWWKRRARPLAFVGWIFFLIAHSIEASFLPLEMYYEHRNYLPSVGLLLAVMGLVAPVALRRIEGVSMRWASLPTVASLAFVVVLAIATFGRVLVWQSFDTIVAQGVQQHPNSIRAVSDAAWLAIKHKQFDKARTAMNSLITSRDPRARVFGHLQLAVIDCHAGDPLDASNLDLAVSEVLPTATVYEAQIIKMFDSATLLGACKAESVVFANAAQRIIDAATGQPETNRNKYVPREVIARLYARGGRWDLAERQAALSWSAGRNLPTGALLAQIYLENKKYVEAGLLVAELESLIHKEDVGGQAALRQLRHRTAARDTAQPAAN